MPGKLKFLPTVFKFRLPDSWRSESRLFFQNAYLMVMPAETLATTKVKIAKIYAFVHRNLMINMENEIQLINSVIFVI